MSSRDAEKIMAHPMAQHTKLQPVAQRLADDRTMTLDRAVALLSRAAVEAKLTTLDIEMAQPANATRTGFAVTETAPETHGDRVVRHLKAIRAANTNTKGDTR